MGLFTPDFREKRRSYILFLSITLAGAAIDIVTKNMVWDNLECAKGRSRAYVIVENPESPSKDYLQFVCTRNRGIIFGLFPGWGDFFLVVTLAAIPLIVIIFKAVKAPTWTFTISLALILAGTIGNVVDRLLIGEVRDFIDFEFINPYVFNLADSFILIGMIVMSIEMFIFDDEGEEKKPVVTCAATPYHSDAAQAPGNESGSTPMTPNAG